MLTRVMGFKILEFSEYTLRDRRADVCLDMSLTYYPIAYHKQSTEYSLCLLRNLADVTEETQNLIENSHVLSISEYTAVKFSGYNVYISSIIQIFRAFNKVDGEIQMQDRICMMPLAQSDASRDTLLAQPYESA